MVRPATIILSDDEFLSSEALDKAREEAEGYAREELSSPDAGTLTFALGTPSLFDAGRLIIVPEAHDLSADSVDVIVRWTKDPSPGIALILLARGAKGDKLSKAIGKGALLVKASAPAPWDTSKWVAARVREHGRKISPEAAQAMVDAIGTELRELSAAISQMLDTTEGGIDVEVVRARFHGLESKTWEFVDSVLERDQMQALKRLRSLIENGENAIGIVTQLWHQFRAVAAVKDGPRIPAEQIAREIGARPGQIKRAFRQARNFSDAEIRHAFALLAQTDLALKSENQDDLVLDLLVDEIMTRR